MKNVKNVLRNSIYKHLYLLEAIYTSEELSTIEFQWEFTVPYEIQRSKRA